LCDRGSLALSTRGLGVLVEVSAAPFTVPAHNVWPCRGLRLTDSFDPACNKKRRKLLICKTYGESSPLGTSFKRWADCKLL